MTKFLGAQWLSGRVLDQAWGELIVNANALLMHYFFQVIQGND